jgi:phage baseplate assembly protein W
LPPFNQSYRDLDLDFVANPNTGNLNIKKDDAAILRALKNVLFTSRFEKPFDPEFGSDIKSMLFEPIDTMFALDLTDIIKDAVNNYEPRVELTEVVVDAKPDLNAYHVFLKFFIINSPVERKLDFLLERLR